MSPCIQLYNNYSTDDWEALCSHFEILKFAKPDYIHFKRLLQLLLKLSKSMKKENIHFIVSHEMIATYVDKNIDDTISLINIDHHHDIAYTDKDIENKIEDLNCGNWVKYLSEKANQKIMFGLEMKIQLIIQKIENLIFHLLLLQSVIQERLILLMNYLFVYRPNGFHLI